MVADTPPRPPLHYPWGHLIFHQLEELGVMLLVSHVRGGRMSSLGVAVAGRRGRSIQLCPRVWIKPEVQKVFTFCTEVQSVDTCVKKKYSGKRTDSTHLLQ